MGGGDWRAVVNSPGTKTKLKKKFTRIKDRITFGIIGISLSAHFG
jgi:hypothetical protein